MTTYKNWVINIISTLFLACFGLLGMAQAKEAAPTIEEARSPSLQWLKCYSIRDQIKQIVMWSVNDDNKSDQVSFMSLFDLSWIA